MAETGRLSVATRGTGWIREHPVTVLRIFIIVTVLLIWEGLAQSGLLYRDVVPSLGKIGASLIQLLTVPDLPWRVDIPWLGIATDIRVPSLYWHLYATFYEIVLGMLIGGVSGLAVGILLGGSKLMQRAYDTDIHVTERTLDSHVRRIRAKFRAVGTDPIATVHGVGYKASES